MPDYSANNVRIDIGLSLQELENQANHLLDDLSLEYNKMLAGGMSAAEANSVVMGWVKNETDFFQTFVNQNKQRINAMTKELVAKPINLYAKANPDEKFKWVLSGNVKNHCPDCSKLSKMEARTIAEWRKLGFGLPREALTACSYGCRCLLEPVK